MIVVIGGTGTLGKALSKVLVSSYDGDVTIVSRCELKQKQMQKDFPSFRYVVGDVTKDNWTHCVQGKPETVFNLSAMKHVDVAESNVEQCFDINYGGTVKSYKWAQSLGANYVFTSTDKGVLPINAYGYSKAAAEKFLYSMKHHATSVAVYRWGNVLGSRGSVLHAFKESLESGKCINVTHESMTRFWMHIDDVAYFMWNSYEVPTTYEPHIPEIKAATVLDLGRATAHVLGVTDYQVNYTGIRPGEKIHECLRTGHDYCLSSNNCEQYTFEELCNLVERSL